MQLSLSVGSPGTPEYGLDMRIKIGRAVRSERDALTDVLNARWGTSRLPDLAEWCLSLASAQHLSDCLQWIAGALWDLADYSFDTPPNRFAMLPNTCWQTARRDGGFEEDA
ncbi:hypothetical protein GCM10008956_29870 [Deinococcus arenae]|uniref:Uncharacterized protein n=1 Tax=Deinococcus arenae TaxID=1452751 RepID=A0A8H9GU90_9DEIO|nr:hypothetical protein GCM10008956_29870 [Deinococcus arenae]